MATPTAEMTLEDRVLALEGHISAAEIVARLLEADPHGFGKRLCQTCKSVSAVVGRDFGCIAYAKEILPQKTRTTP